ncbi:spermidine hydroxycinnamoyl transferase-like [Salvia miltiorrhiza]|uniref:spermidine hydroxycinnamoyl transferase-like n=1 Tax=Salvia miltiorrhiza TaxID=226208 RepID=UPI0025AD895B|nr:spermidine hydroxycinnamoyl transferase-like [Salvia miltiorrhiza]
MATVEATHIVRPAEATPDEIMYLNAGDQIKDILHTPTLYFYKHSAVLDAIDAVSRLKDSLGKALVPFYPLAGRLSWAAEGGGRVELHCRGQGVPIFEAHSDAAVEDFGDFRPTPAMLPFIPSVDYTAPIHEIPMLIVQLTRLRCGGVTVGLGFSHVVADGSSALHFVGEWAKIARGVGPAVPPYLDRKALEADTPPISEFDAAVLGPMPTLLGQEDDPDEQEKPVAVALLSLSKTLIEKLRGKANLGLDNASCRGYSRFEAVAAHIWRCTSKARGHAAEQPTGLFFVADFRKRLNPPLPENYFGNALFRVVVTEKSGSLLSNPISAASRKIREAVEKVTDDAVRGYMDYLKKLPDVGRFRSLDSEGRPKRGLLGNPNVVIISWAALPLLGTDFGWGKEMNVGPGPIGLDGKSYILPGDGGDGGLNVAIWLQEDHLDEFKKCFYDDI